MDKPNPGEFYRHFKGNLYQVITVAKHTETNEIMVVYQALYDDFQYYVRPLAMFMSLVDEEKYPELKGKKRFTKEEILKKDEFKKLEIKEEKIPQIPSQKDKTTQEERTITPDEVLEGVDPRLLAFLDAETYEEKLRVFSEMHDNVDAHILNNIAAVLDISPGEGNLTKQYNNIYNDLKMFMHFEKKNRR